MEKLRALLLQEYPHISKILNGQAPKRTYLSLDKLQEEADIVQKLMQETPPMPMGPGEIYHVVSMQWYKQWKKYTGSTTIITPGESEGESTMTENESSNNVNQIPEKS